MTDEMKALADEITNARRDRYLQILRLRAQGLTTRSIAEQLNLKHSTVRVTLSRLLKQASQ